MPLTIDLKAKGKFTNPNPLEVAAGAMIEADNCIIDRDDTTEQRRGFKRYGTTMVGAKLFNYKQTLLVQHGTSLAYDSDGAGTWVDYVGSYSPPSGVTRIRSIEANKNFYFLTNAGVKKLDSITGTIVAAGMPKALDGSAALAGVSGWMTNNTQVAYRIIWGFSDANNNKIIGSPSQRILIANASGGTRNVDITFTIPATITTAHFYQIYRSGMTAAATDEPNDELQLIVEKAPTAGQIAALSVVYSDLTTESLRGATLYTSPSQQGILQANEQPPLARDVVAYKQMVLFGNTISKHRLNMTLISVGASAGIQVNDTITIAGVVYTGKAAEVAASGQFLVDTSGTPAANIDSTAKSLIRVINSYASNTTVYAYYLTGYNDLPGQILIEERGIGGASFVAISSRGGAFNPTLPAAGTTYTSVNDVSINRMFISKPGQPEAVPLLQYIECGSANKNILRVVALRDSVFILKEDGVYRMIGEDPSTLRVSLFDSTTELLNIDSATPFNNQVYCYSTQGIASISDSGVAIVSRPIEPDLLKISASQYTNFGTASFAAAYESDRKYIFCTVSDEPDTYSTQQIVYNSLTNTFTRWTLSLNHAIVADSDNKLYYCNADTNVQYIMQERKTFTNMDYADDDLPVQITGQSGLSVVVVSSANAVVGWTLSDGVRQSIITQVPDTTHIVVTDYLTWPFGSAAVYKPIKCVAKWAPQHGGNTGIVKHFTDALMHFRNATFDALKLTYNSDLSGYDEDQTVLPNFAGLWGYFPWGFPSWGGRDTFLQTIRTYIPLNKSRARWINFQITHEQALSNFAIAGIILNYSPMSLRSK